MKTNHPNDTPELILIITASKKDAGFEKIFQIGLDQLKKPHVALSLAIKPAHLKKMLTAIKLMDVMGLYIVEKYQDQNKLLTDITLNDGPINTVFLKNHKYHGCNILSNSYKSYLKTININPAHSKTTVFGTGHYLKCLISELSKKNIADIQVFENKDQKTPHTLIKKRITKTDCVIICGPESYKIPKSVFSNLPKGSTIIDMREGFPTYPIQTALLKKKFIKNHRFMAHLVSESIKLWTKQTVDSNLIARHISHLRTPVK